MILFVAFTMGAANAQVRKVSDKRITSIRLVKNVKINGINYQVYTKNIKEDIVEIREPQNDPNAPRLATELKHLMVYNRDASGEEYVLYRVNSKGKKIMELTFPKRIKNGENKVTTEGNYLIDSNHFVITYKKFDYHFPSEMTTVYNVDKYGRMSFLQRNEKALDTDSFSDDYIKKTKENTIKSN